MKIKGQYFIIKWPTVVAWGWAKRASKGPGERDTLSALHGSTSARLCVRIFHPAQSTRAYSEPFPCFQKVGARRKQNWTPEAASLFLALQSLLANQSTKAQTCNQIFSNNFPSIHERTFKNQQQRLLLDFITDFDTIFDKSYLNKYS